ncbi:MAG: TIR domain-containing protein [Anaerolineae bacterium]|nr:TIR domain-containing protein [Anaerolineae bacterium]
MDDETLIGQKLGEYEILGLIADGKRNTIYEAYQPSLKRSVALRTLNKTLRANPQNVAAFVQEVALFATLEHPYIVPVHDYGVEREYNYMVYRLLRGGSLKDRTANTGLPLQEAATILKQIASALDYVHSRGIAAGELTRANFMFDTWGTPYLVNLFYANMRRTDQGEYLAIRYMAPERWQGTAATPASDQYALGILAYSILTTQRPFIGTNDELEALHTSAFPLPLEHYRPEIPPAANEVIFRAIAKEPEDRYPTVMDFARAFEQALNTAPQHLFISYSRRDTAYAKTLKTYIHNNGFQVWLDDEIEHGDHWFNAIHEAIKGCAAFLVVMSPDAEQSEWVQKEILLAKRYQKPIFPLLRAGQEFAILIDIQYADVRSGDMPGVDFHRRLRRAVFGDM